MQRSQPAHVQTKSTNNTLHVIIKRPRTNGPMSKTAFDISRMRQAPRRQVMGDGKAFTYALRAHATCKTAATAQHGDATEGHNTVGWVSLLTGYDSRRKNYWAHDRPYKDHLSSLAG
jgi:hypothetical protein